ncbi:hypothetical protein M3P36_12850 [Altererythrobacter sp. KTW20L]|uniref:hypothetical protein n=1 Tax=Altererythrobacter sp. KTW20L TaxID=2942210 RepID=UPI0020C1811E|nr:hypothetical protein [Altererythrobacter sp. KTW20L]MCL6251928.1 hypothetical protein [Altererythrobacter sp. KTW20L]
MIASHPLATGVLVTIPAWTASGPRVLGRTAPERQVEFAAACGCSEVIALGGGGGAQAVALRHLAESLGMKFREVSGPHALARSGQPGERLLVLEPGLLPDPSAWPRGADSERGIVLTLPSSVGVEAGFERIDLTRAWAGALVLPGALLPRLLALPEDIEAPSALLRIALQASLPEADLDPAALADATWTLPHGVEDARLAEDKWLARQVGGEPGEPLSQRLAGAVLRRGGGKLLERREARPLVLGLALLLAIGAIALCRADFDAAGFLALAIAAPMLELGLGLGRLQRARSGAFKVREKLAPLRWLIDLAILVCGVLAIDGAWSERLFAPLVLLAALYAGSFAEKARWATLRDRGLVAAIIAAGALAHSAQVGVMVAALGLLLLNIAQSRKGGG